MKLRMASQAGQTSTSKNFLRSLRSRTSARLTMRGPVLDCSRRQESKSLPSDPAKPSSNEEVISLVGGRVELICVGIGASFVDGSFESGPFCNRGRTRISRSFGRVAESGEISCFASQYAPIGHAQHADLLVAVGVELDESHLISKQPQAASNTKPSESGTENSPAASRSPRLGSQREGPRSCKTFSHGEVFSTNQKYLPIHGGQNPWKTFYGLARDRHNTKHQMTNF